MNDVVINVNSWHYKYLDQYSAYSPWAANSFCDDWGMFVKSIILFVFLWACGEMVIRGSLKSFSKRV